MALRDDLVGDTWKYDRQYHRLADFLGIDIHEREDLDIAKRASLLWDWAILTSKGSTPEEYLMYLYEVRGKIGTNFQGKTLLGELYNYARLDMDKQRVEKTRQEQEEKIKEQPQKQIEEAPKVEEVTNEQPA